MRLPRKQLETACRVGAFAVLGWLLGSSLIPIAARRVETVRVADLETRLVALTRATPTSAVHAAVETAPAAWETEWLGALRRGGRSVTWNGSPAALGLSVESRVDPEGGDRIDVAAPSGAPVVVSDDGGAIDSVTVASAGATISAPVTVGAIRLRATVAGRSSAVEAAGAGNVVVRPVLIVGEAGWEGKYIATALQERGWPIVARFSVAPNVVVTEGSLVAVDTSRYSAVVAIDSSIASLGPEIERYVRSGGGLVLVGSAAAPAAMSSLIAGTLEARTHPAIKPTDTVRLGSTGFYPVAATGRSVVALERRGGALVVAARRVAAGRVIQLGYDDDWRWRMAGAPGADAEHRNWWTRIVSGVAYAPAVQPTVEIPTEATIATPAPANAFADAQAGTPLALLVDRLGEGRAAPPNVGLDGPGHRLLLTLMIILLLAEWTSRRLRGLR